MYSRLRVITDNDDRAPLVPVVANERVMISSNDHGNEPPHSQGGLGHAR